MCLSPLKIHPYLLVFVVVACFLAGRLLTTVQPVQLYLISDQSDINDKLLSLVKHQRVQIRSLQDAKLISNYCGDDAEPAPVFPKHASDDLTAVFMDTNDACGNVSDLDAVVLVHSAAHHFDRRMLYRKAYANYQYTQPYKLKIVFLIGQALDASLAIQMELENMKYGDTVVGVFRDTYQNLTLKAVMGYRWAAENCAGARLYIKMDDDVFLNVGKFFTTFLKNVHAKSLFRSIFCYVWEEAVVNRSGKWMVQRGLFTNNTYPFPYCAGFFVVLTPDLVQPMYKAARAKDFFWIDDVFMYGMVPDVVGNVKFVQIGRKILRITDNYGIYKKCREKKGVAKCSLWASLTDGEGQLAQELKQVDGHHKY